MPTTTYTAPTMAECLAIVKRELGPDAVILRTRVHAAGPLARVGLPARERVEITATDEAALADSQANATRDFTPTAFRTIRTPAPAVPTTAVEFKPADDRAVSDLRAELAAIDELVRSLRAPIAPRPHAATSAGALSAQAAHRALTEGGLTDADAHGLLSCCGIAPRDAAVPPAALAALLTAAVAHRVREHPHDPRADHRADSRP